MGILDNLFGKSGASKVQRKMKADEESRTKIKETVERESKATVISKQYGVSLADARDFVRHERQKEKRRENVAKLKAGLRDVQEWKKKHVIPLDTKKKRGKKPASMFGGGISTKPVSALTWGKTPKKRKK